MLTKTLRNTLLAIGASLVLGIAGASAAGAQIEEIVVYGIDTSAPAPSPEAVLRTAMDEYVRSLNQELKLELNRKFAEMRVRSIQLAAAEVSTRG